MQAMLALAVGFAGLLVYAFPGYMSSDSATQLIEARSRVFEDWHPPAMAALWMVVERFTDGPAGMLIVQGGLFLAGTYRLLARHFTSRTAAVVASWLLLFPPVLTPLGVIWKDSQMAGFLVFGASLVISERRTTKIAGLVMLAFATALRVNAAAATLPLVLLLWQWHPDESSRRRIAAAFAIWIALTFAAIGVNKALTRVERHAWHVSIAPADIIGILEHSRDYSDEELHTILDGTTLARRENIQQHARKYYMPYSWWDYIVGDRRVFNWPETPEHRAAFTRAWKRMVADNPAAYFRHRLRVFRAALGFNNQPVFDPVWRSHCDIARLGQPDAFINSTGVQGTLSNAWMWLATETPLYRAGLYFCLGVVLLAFARRRRDALAPLASGLLYELGLFPIAPSPDYRYSHWMVCTVLLTAMIIIGTRVRGYREQRRLNATSR